MFEIAHFPVSTRDKLAAQNLTVRETPADHRFEFRGIPKPAQTDPTDRIRRNYIKYPFDDLTILFFPSRIKQNRIKMKSDPLSGLLT